ncbi:TOMM precursor leader peptide-binding protein [Streptomyces gamaensis]|uniref:TOMM leader peptide-binding protein n=1 Tax=Streptomyces gamaensis TaxID=1763542 RepID=A0ABW0YVC4_9ACTN
MTEAYAAVAETRPRIRRDVLFTETPDGVLFHNAHGGFHLHSASAYRFATLIVPHLNGENRVAELCEGLGDKQRSMVGRLVRTLYERDFARDVPEPTGERTALPPEVARRFAQQLAYVDHYADDAEGRFHRFRHTKVAVVGDDALARWCVLALVRNGSASVGCCPDTDIRAEAASLIADGCPVTLAPLPSPGPSGLLGWADLEGYEVVVVTGGRAGARQLFHLLSSGVPEGRALLPASMFGSQALVGPLMEGNAAERTACWACAVLRLGAHDSAAAADLWSGIALPAGAEPTEDGPGRGLAAMIGNLLGYEVFRLTTGALPAETRGQVIVQDTESFDTAAEPLLAHPRCPYCAGGGAHPEAEEPLPLPEPEPRPRAAGTPQPDTDALLAELNSRQPLVRPYTGVVRRFTDEPWTQTPLKVGSVELPVGHGRVRQIAAFDVHTVAGARLAALDAAARVYAERVVPAYGVLTGEELRAARARTRTVAPDALVAASGLPVPSGGVAAYVPAVSLLDKEPVLVPAGAVRPFGPYNRDRLFTPTSAGSGAGRTAASAAGRGLLSALCHDALERAVRGTAGTTRVALDGSDDPELAFLVASARNLGVAYELLDLGEAGRSGAHVLLARAQEPDGDRDGVPLWAAAGECDWQRAGASALRDLLGQVQLGRELAKAAGDPGPVDQGDPLLPDLDPAAVAVTVESAARPGEAAASVTYAELLDRLRQSGRDALAAGTGSADLRAGGISTVRVLLTREAGADAY